MGGLDMDSERGERKTGATVASADATCAESARRGEKKRHRLVFGRSDAIEREKAVA